MGSQFIFIWLQHLYITILGIKWNGIKVTNDNVITFSFEFGHLFNGQDLPKVSLIADAQLNHIHILSCLACGLLVITVTEAANFM